MQNFGLLRTFFAHISEIPTSEYTSNCECSRAKSGRLSLLVPEPYGYKSHSKGDGEDNCDELEIDLAYLAAKNYSNEKTQRVQ